MPNWLTRIADRFVGKSTEGGIHWTMEGGIPSDWGWNYWQQGYDPLPYGAASAVVEACVSAYSQTVAMCPGDHWRTNDDGGRERVTTSDLSRIIRRPNTYQSISDFLLNLTRQLYEEGNAYALALRNARNEITELHLMRSRACSARIAADGSVFYSLGGNDVIDARLTPGHYLLPVPSRDVLHVRLQTPRHPLIGESPIIAAGMDLSLAGTARRQQERLFRNGGRPSAVLSTDQPLKKEQSDQLREAWQAQSKGLQAGGTAVLGSGLKPTPWAQSSVDSQLAEILKMSDQSVALAFRVPLAVLGIGGQTYSSTEMLMQQWVASGLGFALNHIEEAIGNLFELRGQPDEYLEFSTDALLRSAFKDRIEALAAGVHGGIFAPNEARARESLPKAKEGDEPRLQQQDVPLGWWKDQQKLEKDKAKAAAAAPAIPAAPAANDDKPAPDPQQAAKAFKARRRLSRENDVRTLA